MKPLKIPVNLLGITADATSPDNWSSFDAAVTALQAGKFDYLGFALGDGYQGIDLDDIETNHLKWLANILSSYVERSPSGSGLHAIGYGKSFNAFKHSGIECYCGKRSFTVTGDVIRADAIGDLSGVIATHIEPLRPQRDKAERPAQIDAAPTQSDAEIVASLLRVPALEALYHSTSGGNPSVDDLSLVNAIACRSRNRAQAERIWLASDLGQRDKTQRRAGYRQRTLNAAFNFSELPPIDLSRVTCKGEPLCWDAPTNGPSPVEPTIVDAGDWQGQIPPLRKYVLEPFIPAGVVTVFVGDGGGGKSLLLQQLTSSTALPTKFLGLTPMEGTALIVNCEDDLSELHRRQINICGALGKPLSALKGKLFFAALGVGINNELAVFDAQGRMTLTNAFAWLEREIHRLKPNLVVLDNVAHLFAGNENIRNHVAAFLGLLSVLAAETGATILLIAHPNKVGETSGSTAWNNQVRNRLKLEIPKDENGNVIDPDARVLSVEKSNYNRAGQRLEFRWHKGAFVLPSDLPADVAAQVKANAQADIENEAFLTCLAATTAQRRAVSHNPGVNYYGKIFPTIAEANGIGRTAFERAFERLIHQQKLKVDCQLWKRENRSWKYGLQVIEKRTDPPAPTPCTDPHHTPSQVTDIACTELHAPTPLYTTYIKEGGPENPLPPKNEEGDNPWPELI